MHFKYYNIPTLKWWESHPTLTFKLIHNTNASTLLRRNQEWMIPYDTLNGGQNSLLVLILTIISLISIFWLIWLICSYSCFVTFTVIIKLCLSSIYYAREYSSYIFVLFSITFCFIVLILQFVSVTAELALTYTELN